MDELLKRLNRYTRQYLTEVTDPDFADAVEQAKNELKDLRNELCLNCGLYKLDSCGECRWRDAE